MHNEYHPEQSFWLLSDGGLVRVFAYFLADVLVNLPMLLFWALPAGALSAEARSAGDVGCIQLRGEYLYVSQGDGVQVYDVASIANKGISQRIITAPFGPLGHDAHHRHRRHAG